jgi:hypothetical protein
MDLVEKLQKLSNDLSRKRRFAKKEATTRSYLVDPFIEALGYTVNDPEDVEQEFTADIGKQSEQVDYAIKRDRKPIIFIEVKQANISLSDNHAAQLRRYYGTNTDVRLSILTNGVEYRFYADLEKPNVMDDEPYLIVDMRLFDEEQIDVLKVLTKSEFDLERAISVAITSKYRNRMHDVMSKELDPLSDELVEFFIRKVYSGRLTQRVASEFAPLVREAWHKFVDQKNARHSQTKSDLDTTKGKTIPVREKIKPFDPTKLGTSRNSKQISVYAVWHGHSFEATLVFDESHHRSSRVTFDGLTATPSKTALKAIHSVRPDFKAINGWAFWKLRDPKVNQERPIGDLRSDDSLVRRLRGIT